MFQNHQLRIGISPLTWSNDDLPELGGDIPLAKSLAEMAESGFLGTEVGHKFPSDAQALQQALLPHKLLIAGAWFSSYFTKEPKPKETIARFKLHAAFLQAVGADVVNVCECGGAIHQQSTPIFGHKPILTDEEWHRLIEGLDHLGAIANEHDLKLVYHPHMGTVIETTWEVQQLMNATNPMHVHLLLDTGHSVFAGESPLELLKSHGARVKHVHLKDIRPNILELAKAESMSFLLAVKRGVFTVPGDGFIDFVPIFGELDRLNYQGWLMVEAEQDPSLAHPLTYAKKARNYISKHLGL
jgi:inosose dehydratase